MTGTGFAGRGLSMTASECGCVPSASVVRIGDSTITGNGTGSSNTDGIVETLQNNLVRGNATDVAGTLTPIGET